MKYYVICIALVCMIFAMQVGECLFFVKCKNYS